MDPAPKRSGPTGVMGDLTSPTLIVAKGLMFLAIAAMAAYMILRQASTLGVAALLALLAWASARFYYFLFYVLERYVDPALRYSGVIDLLVALWRRGRGGRPAPPERH